MDKSVKHATTNPNLYINTISLLLIVITSVSDQSWVKDNPWFLLIVASVNFILTGVLQILRDINKPPVTAKEAVVLEKDRVDSLQEKKV